MAVISEVIVEVKVFVLELPERLTLKVRVADMSSDPVAPVALGDKVREEELLRVRETVADCVLLDDGWVEELSDKVKVEE